MFREADLYNQWNGNWNMLNVTDMSWMFYDAKSFNKDLAYWDVENVKHMNSMFESALNYNHWMSWKTSNVIDMSNILKVS